MPLVATVPLFAGNAGGIVTVRGADGAVVPIPTFPLGVIVILVAKVFVVSPATSAAAVLN